MGDTAGTKAQPSNQVVESIKNITQTLKHNQIFVHLSGGQQRDGHPSLFRHAPALTRTATLHNERVPWELTLHSGYVMHASALLCALLRWHLLGMGRQVLTSAGQQVEQHRGEPGSRASRQC